MKTLFLFWHGLGDNILATPVIKKYKETTGDYIGWAMLKDFRSVELFEANPYVDEIHWVSNPWRDFGCYPKGIVQVIEEARIIQRENGYDRLCVVSHQSSQDHKILRTAFEMGVELDENELHTEVYYDESNAAELAKDIWLPDEYVFFHGKTSVKTKDLPRVNAEAWLKSRNLDLPLVSPGMTWDCDRYPMSVTIHILKRARAIIVVDSVMYHVAHALGLPVDAAYFARGEKVWSYVHPLHESREKVYYSLRDLSSGEVEEQDDGAEIPEQDAKVSAGQGAAE